MKYPWFFELESVDPKVKCPDCGQAHLLPEEGALPPFGDELQASRRARKMLGFIGGAVRMKIKRTKRYEKNRGNRAGV